MHEHAENVYNINDNEGCSSMQIINDEDVQKKCT